MCTLFFLTVVLFSCACGQDQAVKELHRYPALEAHQGVAVDTYHFYAVGTKTIGKYDKATGHLIKQWKAAKNQPILHLDSGVVVENKLYCGHSNYPNLPMTSSIEIWDTFSLEHIESYSLGISNGSCTWVDRYKGFWWVCFAHYNTRGGYPDKDNRWTRLVKYNQNWQPLESWIFPETVLNKFGDYSCSGGSWGTDGLLYCTGHDLGELYVLGLPKVGSVLELVTVLSVNSQGQGIAWDRSEKNILYTIHRENKAVIANQLNQRLD